MPIRLHGWSQAGFKCVESAVERADLPLNPLSICNLSNTQIECVNRSSDCAMQRVRLTGTFEFRPRRSHRGL
jgi:hypothetical protein